MLQLTTRSCEPSAVFSEIVAFVGTLLVGIVALCAHRVADAVVPGLAPPLHRARVEAVPERRAVDRQSRRQPALRGRARPTWRWTSPASGSSPSRRSRSTTASSSSSRPASCSTRSRSISRSCASSRDAERLEPRPARQARAEGSQPRRAAPHRSPCRHPDHRRERVDRRSHAPRNLQAARAGSTGSNVKAGFEYAPVHYTVTLDQRQLPRDGAGPRRCSSWPARLPSGTTICTSTGSRSRRRETALKVDGVIERYLSARGPEAGDDRQRVAAGDRARHARPVGLQPASRRQREDERARRAARA